MVGALGATCMRPTYILKGVHDIHILAVAILASCWEVLGANAMVADFCYLHMVRMPSACAWALIGTS